MINFSDPWSIIGWGLIYMVVGFIVIVLIIALVQFFKTLKQKWRYQKAHAGKLKCELKDCDTIATHRTPNGFFCTPHSLDNSLKYISVGSMQWRDRLKYLREK